MTHPILLYDGTCGFCAASVQLVLRHDRTGTLRFASLQGPTGQAAILRHPELAGADSVVWVEPATADHPERVYLRSAAALRTSRYLGGVWHLMRIGWLVPRPLRDAIYDLVARHRHRIPIGADRCDLPAPEARERFLD
ncbi:MAG: thiol-disulfide oxidoreductase [Gemmatimonadetes bacterium HGW-Gemmatimonadetes-1]|jgi:predicted DCC family thiol-disulfide oxidoreductase YuxK|nr:MAG: thiol-disulfide oxidoreductase [Gemmatimonadetes bacterium HGW-Gemmatimonadetes-1]